VALVFEPLQAHHDRAAFDCGKEPLNEFLRRRARQNAERNVGVTHVAVPAPGSATILGYYTLLVRTVAQDIIPDGKRLPAGEIGVVLLGRLAVDKRAQGQGIGKTMLLRAIRQVVRASRDMGIYALVLDALDTDARAWYLGLGWGFKELLDSPNHLCLPIATLRLLGITGDETPAGETG